MLTTIRKLALIALIICSVTGCATMWPDACTIKETAKGERYRACDCKAVVVANKPNGEGGGVVGILCNGDPLPVTVTAKQMGKLCK